MILLSVGTQLPFDRLVVPVDRWAERSHRRDVMAQIGPSSFVPRALNSFPFLDAASFRQLQQDCSLMVSHAGMGSIITALELGKPIIVLARDARRREHRNNHQESTVRQFRHLPGIYAAQDEAEVVALLDRADELAGYPATPNQASKDFAARLAGYLHDAPPTLVDRVRAWFTRSGDRERP